MAEARIATVNYPESNYHGKDLAFCKEGDRWVAHKEGLTFPVHLAERYLTFQKYPAPQPAGAPQPEADLNWFWKKPATDTQIGGAHYRDMKLQPIDFIMQNNLDFCTGNAIKYLCRHKAKNGKQDLEKAVHYIQMLMEREYPDAE